MKLSYENIYKYLNNIDMILLRTSYIGMGSSSNIILTCNLVRLGVYMVKICHEKMLTLEMYPSKIN